ncbi:CIC11C00000002090 [Sungouiella intermedia]|uniref:CIC11C00000002090 n=1 Tax=Sungouiella intermedia TaxID=45354 RepID=A0A1L0E2J0_9ASCO|nr:CIC11C00000002090 [[Candida] intermedia]
MLGNYIGIFAILALLVFSHQNLISFNDKFFNHRIAIIGAGPGGTSAAYYLQKYTNYNYNITIFEKSSRIGGRTITIDLYGNSSLPFEAGASIFVSANKILNKAAQDFNLKIKKYRSSVKHDSQLSQVGLYNGTSIYLEINDSWTTYVKLLWRYGLAPVQVARLSKKFLSSFLTYFYERNFPFVTLNSITKISGLYAGIPTTADKYFDEQGIKQSYYKEIIQSFTRVNYAQNIDQIHAVGALVSLATDNPLQIEGGNWQIFTGMANSSKALVNLNTEVSTIEKLPNGKWSVGYNGTLDTFDTVIIASPLKLANIDLAYSVPDVKFVDLHVTIFTSNETLLPEYFGQDADSKIPGTILTTVNLSSTPPLEFFSVSIHDYLEDTQEYVLKVFSPKLFTNEDIALLFSSSASISWVHRKEFYSYPYLEPVLSFADFELDNGLWYLNTMESFISTMETSALAGANVAGLISEGRNTSEISIP